jgi:hypothetical protein
METQKQPENEIDDIQQPDVSKYKFADEVLEKRNILATIGKSYRRKIYKLNDIVELYITNMGCKFINFGATYIKNMSSNVELICNNVSRESSYDTLDFVNSIIDYFFKNLAYKYKLTKKMPNLPDYTIAEIKEIAEQINITKEHV